MASVLDEEQVDAAQMLTSVPHPEVADYRDVALPLRVDGERPRGSGTPPGAGAHTEEILRGLGYTTDEIEVLVASGAVMR